MARTFAASLVAVAMQIASCELRVALATLTTDDNTTATARSSVEFPSTFFFFFCFFFVLIFSDNSRNYGVSLAQCSISLAPALTRFARSRKEQTTTAREQRRTATES